MPISEIKTVEFWAREYRMPLFWLTDPKNVALMDRALFLYKENVVHCYYVNERNTDDQKIGYEYFSTPGNFEAYIAESQDCIARIAREKESFDRLDLKKHVTRRAS